MLCATVGVYDTVSAVMANVGAGWGDLIWEGTYQGREELEVRNKLVMQYHVASLALHFLLPDGLGAAAREADETGTLCPCPCPCVMSRDPLLSRSSTICMCFSRASTSDGIWSKDRTGNGRTWSFSTVSSE